MDTLIYEYEPYLSQENRDIPCFRIYSSDYEVLAETNENLPVEQQEKIAQLFTHSADLASGLSKAIKALKYPRSEHERVVLAVELEKLILKYN